MANYETIARIRPGFEEFTLQKRLVHRGDVLCFPRSYSSPVFSTDKQCFRHTAFEGQSLSIRDVVHHDRYGLVLGGSQSFGLGLAGNENTLPSLLSERFGFPFANVGLPQGNSRNLSSMLTSIVGRAPQRPSAVVLFNLGDLTGLAYSSVADPVFGSPNPKQVKYVREERGALPPPEKSAEAVLAFTSLWTRTVALTCQAHKIPFVIGDESTFFEKTTPSSRDLKCELGTPFHAAEERWFTSQKKFGPQFYQWRTALAVELGVPIAGPGARNDLGFIDEFHLDEDGTKSLTDDVAAALEPLIKA